MSHFKFYSAEHILFNLLSCCAKNDLYESESIIIDYEQGISRVLYFISASPNRKLLAIMEVIY